MADVTSRPQPPTGTSGVTYVLPKVVNWSQRHTGVPHGRVYPGSMGWGVVPKGLWAHTRTCTRLAPAQSGEMTPQALGVPRKALA